MIFKLLSLSILFLPLLSNNEATLSVNNNDAFILENIEGNNYSLIGVNDEYLSYEELRIYNDESRKIVSIKDGAFSSCENLSSLMISYSVNEVEALPSSITSIYYTGSFEMFNEISYSPLEGVTIYDYSFDEGFIYFWNTLIRPERNTDICKIDRDVYLDLINRYESLGDYDKNVVDEYEDIAGIKIKDTIVYLKQYFSSSQSSNKTNFISQEKTMSIIVIITIIGMTTIAIFYLLKKLDIIS